MSGSLAQFEDAAEQLEMAVFSGDLREIRRLLRAGCDPDGTSSNRGRPVFGAIVRDRAQALRLLISLGARLDKTDFRGRTALHWAAWEGALRCVPVLLANGVKLDARDRDGRTALQLACLNSWERRNAQLIVRRLLDAGAKVNTHDKEHHVTPLHDAALTALDKAVAGLIRAGARLNARDRDGQTPLHVAAEWGERRTVSLLLRAGAKPGVNDLGGKTPTDLAREHGHEEIVEVISTFKRRTDRQSAK